LLSKRPPTAIVMYKDLAFNRAPSSNCNVKVPCSYVRKQNWLKKNYNHFTHRSYRGDHNKSTSRKKNVGRPTLNVKKKFVCRPEIF